MRLLGHVTSALHKVANDCPADPTNNCLMKPRTIKNGYAKEPIVTNNSHGQAETKNDQTTKGHINQQLRPTAW